MLQLLEQNCALISFGRKLVDSEVKRADYVMIAAVTVKKIILRYPLGHSS